MVERSIYLDGLFGSLADPIRRDILLRLMHAQYTVGQIAEKYDISFAAVAKHIGVLEKATLITKQKKGKKQIVHIAPHALRDASYYLRQYEILWDKRFDVIDKILKEDV